MKIHEYKIQNREVIHIYIDEDEEKDISIQEKVKQLKYNNKAIVFVSGNNDPKEILKRMVKIIKRETITNIK